MKFKKKDSISQWLIVNTILLILALMLTSCEKEPIIDNDPIIEKDPYWGWEGKEVKLYKLTDADFDFVLEVRNIDQYTVGVKVVQNTLTGETICEEKEVGRDALIGFEPCPYCLNNCQ